MATFPASMNVQPRATAIPSSTWTPLQTAAAAGLGTYEKGDPMKKPIGSGYSKIQYVYIDGAG
jgi:hypothetical protein